MADRRRGSSLCQRKVQPRNHRSISGRVKICLFKLVQTGRGAHTADYAVGTEGKAAGA